MPFFKRCCAAFGGDVAGPSAYLSSLDSADIKNRKWLDGLLEYFGKKGDAITCYALRAKLGLRNSSNPVEKANDLVVAGRQKHNGMAWSPNGSGTLAALQMIYLNQFVFSFSMMSSALKRIS